MYKEPENGQSCRIQTIFSNIQRKKNAHKKRAARKRNRNRNDSKKDIGKGKEEWKIDNRVVVATTLIGFIDFSWCVCMITHEYRIRESQRKAIFHDNIMGNMKYTKSKTPSFFSLINVTRKIPLRFWWRHDVLYGAPSGVACDKRRAG